jgi:hypothetical protein
MEDKSTSAQAYKAMYAFLTELNDRLGFDQLGGLLGGMSFVAGTPADPAIWNDWLRAVEKAKGDQIDLSLRLR